MPIPQNKEELIYAINYSYAKLKVDLEDIPSELTQRKDLPGHAKGTKMSIVNLVAYLIGWGELVLKWNRKEAEGALIDFPETGYKWNELGELAQKFYTDYSALDYPSLLSKLDEVVYQILSLIEQHDNADLYEVSWYEKWTKGRMIQLNTYSPYKNARARVRKWKKEHEKSS